MGFIKGATSIDLGDTPIENIFIDVYMPMANGTFVKVYLLGYKYGCDKDASMDINNRTLSKNLNIPLSDVLAAWDFWESKGIIKKHPLEDGDETNYSVEFLSLKQLYIDNNYKPLSRFLEEENSKPSFSCSPQDLIEANKVPEIKNMFLQINEIISRPLVPNEKRHILEWLYNYNIDPPLIVKAYSYCKHKKNIKNTKYVGGVLRNWYDLGISTLEGLQDYLLKQGERYSLYDRVFKAMGFISREPSEAEMEVMNRWVDEFGFNLDIILRACENCSKTSNPNINYIHSILNDWHNKGVKQLEDIKRLEDLRQKERAANFSPTKDKATRIKTKFHLAESRGDEYTAEELEQLILNNQRKKLDK